MKDSPLIKLIKTEQEANTLGFQWPNSAMILEQILSECTEIKAALEENEPRAQLQEEIGDLLQAAISLNLFYKFDIEETLELVNNKFRTRILALKGIMAERGIKTLNDQTLDDILFLWQEAKKRAIDNKT